MKAPKISLNTTEMVEQQYTSVDAARRAVARAIRWLRSPRHFGTTPPHGIRQKMKLLDVDTGGGRQVRMQR